MGRGSRKKGAGPAEVTNEELERNLTGASVQAIRTLSGNGPEGHSASPMTPEEISSLRKGLRLSQSDFAWVLNVSLQTVQAWEQGVRRPGGAALRLLNIVRRDHRVLRHFS